MDIQTNTNPVKISEFVSVNFHLTYACNYTCKFCFARFPQTRRFLSLEKAKELIGQLHQAGTKKLTFVGGEPLLYPDLGQLIIFTKESGITTSIVTNGSLVTKNFLEKYGSSIDWIGLSIYSADPAIENRMGRYSKQQLQKGSDHIQTIRKLAPKIKFFGIKLKINTVITSLNWNEDMSFLLTELQPSRWKVFQVLPIKGENDGEVEPLLVTTDQFKYFIQRHKWLQPVHETNEMMTGSYVMIDPLGRFFDNTSGFLRYSRPILEAGVESAFQDIKFSQKQFMKRGGFYNWKNLETLPVVLN